MKATGWERIYRQKGDVQGFFKVMPMIKRAAGLFREKSYSKILDMACGTGRHTLYLAKQGFEMYATDMSGTALKMAREKAAALGLHNIHFQEHDMRSIPFAEGFFDAVICTLAIHHGTAAQIQKTVNEIHRVLKPGGAVMTDMPSVTTDRRSTVKEIEKNTFLFVDDELESDVPHHYTDREELKGFFRDFSDVKIRLNTRKIDWQNDGKKHVSRRYFITAVK
jgi:ubiquinone/menaquinone biosynthesis C-methylase UbiE